jgi:hypothetical protein
LFFVCVIVFFLNPFETVKIMRKSVFGLVVAGATLAGAIGSTSPASAINYVYDGNTYNVQTYTGSFNELYQTLTDATNLLWGNSILSRGLAEVVRGDLGSPNQNLMYNTPSRTGPSGPLFGSSTGGGATVVSYSAFDTSENSVFEYIETVESSRTYATATAVPWETDALPVIGSTILFAGGLWARNKFAKPLQK